MANQLSAYELADKAEAMKTGEYGYVDGWIEEAAYMLRQQAEELKACKIHERRGWEYAEELEKERRKQADRIAELEKDLEGCEYFLNKDKSGNSISAEEYQKTHEGFSTIQEVIAKHEAIPSRKEAISKAREWLKDYRIEVSHTHSHKELSDEEIADIWIENSYGVPLSNITFEFARAIIKASRGEV